MTWTLAVGVAVAMALSSLGRVGGVRLDADAGFCEPGDQWTVTSHSVTVVRPDGTSTTRVAAGKLSSLPATCVREVGGLMPGPYRVMVTPPRAVLPPYSFSFEVRARQWTRVPLMMPPVVVRGRITADGQPVPGVVSTFVATPATMAARMAQRHSPSIFVDVPSDYDGRYAAVLWTPGTYTQTFKVGGQELSGVKKDVTFAAGITQHDVEVGAGMLRVWFTERGVPLSSELPVAVTLHALPQRPFVRNVRATSLPVDVAVLSPGAYVVRATAERRGDDGRMVTLVSARQHDITVAAHQATDVTIDLVPRDGWLEVVDVNGRPIEGASVLTYPGAASLRTDEQGRVSLATVPGGARVPIRTRTWGITCHVVTDDFLQRASVAEADEQVVLRIPHGKAGVRPSPQETVQARTVIAGAAITGLVGSACPLPIEAFAVAEARVPGAVELSISLPLGWYTLTLRDGRTFRLQAPSAVEIK